MNSDRCCSLIASRGTVARARTASTRIVRNESDNEGFYYSRDRGPQFFKLAPTHKVRRHDGKPLGEATIPAKGLEGLYPDDVYDVLME